MLTTYNNKIINMEVFSFQNINIIKGNKPKISMSIFFVSFFLKPRFVIKNKDLNLD